MHIFTIVIPSYYLFRVSLESLQCGTSRYAAYLVIVRIQACSIVVSKLREMDELGEEPPERDIWVLPCYGPSLRMVARPEAGEVLKHHTSNDTQTDIKRVSLW